MEPHGYSSDMRTAHVEEPSGDSLVEGRESLWGLERCAPLRPPPPPPRAPGLRRLVYLSTEIWCCVLPLTVLTGGRKLNL